MARAAGHDSRVFRQSDQVVEVDGLLKIRIGVQSFGTRATVVGGGHADHRHVAKPRVGELPLA